MAWNERDNFRERGEEAVIILLLLLRSSFIVLLVGISYARETDVWAIWSSSIVRAETGTFIALQNFGNVKFWRFRLTDRMYSEYASFRWRRCESGTLTVLFRPARQTLVSSSLVVLRNSFREIIATRVIELVPINIIQSLRSKGNWLEPSLAGLCYHSEKRGCKKTCDTCWTRTPKIQYQYGVYIFQNSSIYMI
jgi:hypothetical protein